MRVRYVARTVASGAVFYVIAAACGSADSVGNAADGGSIADALVDGVTHPVKEASAGPPPADVAVEKCDKTGTIGTLAAGFAVHDYPGKTVQDLTGLRVVAHFADGSPSRVLIGNSLYENGQSIAVLRDGQAAVFCGAAASQAQYDTVTFILP